METLRSVYWSMTQVTGVSNRNGAAISVRRLSAQEGAELYEFSEEQKALLSNLAEQKGTVEEIVGESIFASLTEEEFAAVCEQIPEEISADRRAVLMAALSLEEKVDYFWGGKSLAYGWDETLGADAHRDLRRKRYHRNRTSDGAGLLRVCKLGVPECLRAE